jgi:hypothetical protein
MTRKKRDWKKEYQRRIQRGLAKGYSRARARGHARAGDIRRKRPAEVDPNDPREKALKLMKSGSTQKAAAKSVGISVEKLRRYIKENTTAKLKGKKWIIIDRRPVSLIMASNGKLIWVNVGRKSASKIGFYWNAVNKFLQTNDISFLAPYRGAGIYDINKKKFHPFETGPNNLRKLDSIGELSFVDIYRNVSN